MLVSDSRVRVDSTSGVVYFTPVHKDDEGSYNCTAFNDVGAVSSSNQLLVYGIIFGISCVFGGLPEPNRACLVGVMLLR